MADGNYNPNRSTASPQDCPPASSSTDLTASPQVGERPPLPEPYWQDEKRGLRLFHGDCRDILPCFADGEFGSVITDPPYGVGRTDYQDVPPDSAVLAQCLRVAIGPIVMWCGASVRSQVQFLRLEPLPERTLVWAPSFILNHSATNGMFWAFHPIQCWRLPKDQDVLPMDVLRKPATARRAELTHRASRPVGPMIDLCAAFGGTSVLDPYLGSGTTLAACAKLGLPGVGIELEERYCEMAAARLSEDLSYGERNLFTPREVEVAR